MIILPRLGRSAGGLTQNFFREKSAEEIEEFLHGHGIESSVYSTILGPGYFCIIRVSKFHGIIFRIHTDEMKRYIKADIFDEYTSVF